MRSYTISQRVRVLHRMRSLKPCRALCSTNVGEAFGSTAAVDRDPPHSEETGRSEPAIGNSVAGRSPHGPVARSFRCELTQHSTGNVVRVEVVDWTLYFDGYLPAVRRKSWMEGH